jgi:hypothetical protein
LADYNANIKVSADTKRAESELTKLQKTLNNLSDFSLKLNSKDIGRQVTQVGQQLRGIGERGAVGAVTLAAGKATTALSVLGAKFGVVGAAAAAAAGTINSTLGGVPGVITSILDQLGHIPSAFGLAAVAAMAFAPQLTKAAAGAVGLGAAVDKAVGGGVTQKFAALADGVGQLNMELNAVKATFADLLDGSTLNQLNDQLRDAVEQSGAFHSSTLEAVTAAEQLVETQRQQVREQKAINDLVRKAQGLQPQDVRDTEVARRVSQLKSRELQQQADLRLQGQINAELADYERLAADVATQTKRWADNLDRVARASRSGVLGNTNQLSARVEEFRRNRQSADIARQRSAEALALESRQTGANYGLNQVPARGELFPGGNSVTASPQYRSMLNAQATTRAAATDAIAKSERTILGFQAQTLRTETSITAAKRQQQAIDERSIAAARERNALLLKQYAAEQRVANGQLDRRSRVADLRNQKSRGKDLAQRTESIALGVGFPLLFGGGAGTVGGSLAGSFVGTGFGGQILGGAIGQAIDQFIIKVTDLGKALADPTRAFDALKEAALISSKAVERDIEKLQEAGFAATASARAQEDFARSVGTDGVEALLAAGSASDRLGRAFAQLGVQMQALAAGPIATAQNRFADVVGAQAAFGRAAQVSSALRRNGNTTAADRLDNATTRFSLSPNNTLGLDPGKIRQGLQQAITEAEKSLPPVKIRLSTKQIREELLNTLGKQLEAIDTARGLSSQVRNQARAQLDTDQQRYELIQSSERTIADLRRGIEDRIAQQRLTNLQRENELLNVQADIRLQSLRNNNVGLRSGFTNDKVSAAAGAVADYLERELEVQNQIDQQKRDTQLEIQRVSIETEQYKLQVAQQVARLNEDNAKRVAEINKGVRRANEDNDTRRFDIEKRIAVIKLKMLADELAVAARDPSAPLPLRQESFNTYNAVRGRIAEVEGLQAPSRLKEVAGAPRYGASTSGSDAASARGTELLGNLQAARTALLDLVRAGNLEQLKAQLSDALDKPLQKAANDAQQVWDALQGNGLGGQSTEAATRNAALTDLVEQLGELKKETTNTGVQQLIQGYIDSIPALSATSDEIRVNTDLLSELNTKYIELQDTLLATQSPYGQLTETQRVRNALLREGMSLESSYAQEVLKQAAAVDALQQQVRLATQLQDVWQGVGNAMGEAMTTGVVALVNGTQSAQQVFAQFLQAVGQALSSAASQMIATYIAIGIAKLFAGLGSAGGAGGAPSVENLNAGAAQYGTGASFTMGDFGGFRAAGGPVASSSAYIVGERGPELFVPGTGGSVVPTSDLRSAMGSTSGTSTTPVLNMSFQSTNIGGVEYVSRDQLEAAMAATRREASRDGAKRGMSMTLDKLQQSPGTRNRVGLR